MVAVARADQQASTIVTGGLLVGGSQNQDDPSGNVQLDYGVELTLVHTWGHPEHIDDRFYPGLGAFAQLEYVDGDRLRATAGPQVNYGPFGVEVGLAWDQDDGTYAATLSAHVAPFVSIGIASIAVRADFPLSHDTSVGPGYGVNYGLIFTLKLPFGLDGAAYCHAGHGMLAGCI
jgi:hypothetical protein